MTKLPKITIVTPSYNQGEFLEDTILSVLGQRYPNLEYFVIDGGSQDNSVELLKKYDKSISWWTSEKDGGQAEAINRGFLKASGDILCWLNSDDFLMPGVLKKVASEMLSSITQPTLLYGGCFFFEESTGRGKSVIAERYDKDFLLLKDYIIQPSTFWNRALWERTGPLDEQLVYTFDWDWFIRASQHTDFQNSTQVFSSYRFHPAHKSSTGKDARALEILEVVHRYGDESLQELYDLVYNKNHHLTNQFKLLQKIKNYPIPFRNRIGFALYPSLYKLNTRFTMKDIRYVKGMLSL